MTQTTTENTNSTETNEVEPTESAQIEATQGAQEGTEGADSGETGNKAGREAAKYRRQLRTVEAERDALNTTLETARDIILNNHFSKEKIGLKASGLKQLGHNSADLLNDDLTINGSRLQNALQSIRESGFNYSTRPESVPSSGTGTYGTASHGNSLTWGDALHGGKS